MRFKINGANVSKHLTLFYYLWYTKMYSRGGNMIPLEEFEGKANADAFYYLLQSVVDGNLNTLRIWGGGVSFLFAIWIYLTAKIFLYDVFYDTCDELGILIYHDMMYAQGGHSPNTTDTQDAEIRHNVRRLSSHPSIVVSFVISVIIDIWWIRFGTDVMNVAVADCIRNLSLLSSLRRTKPVLFGLHRLVLVGKLESAPSTEPPTANHWFHVQSKRPPPFFFFWSTENVP